MAKKEAWCVIGPSSAQEWETRGLFIQRCRSSVSVIAVVGRSSGTSGVSWRRSFIFASVGIVVSLPVPVLENRISVV